MIEAESFYDEFASQEWERLEHHRTEFAVSLKALQEYLPPPPCSILDIGGGPGRYAIELSRLGYVVTLVDISSESLQLAEVKAEEAGVSLQSFIHADVMQLSQYVTDQYDAVLLMGPLYHLLLEEERVQAVQESKQALKPKGRLFASFITRSAPFRQAASEEPDWILKNWAYALSVLETGQHEQTTRFAKAYFIHPDEVIPLMEGCGLQTLLLLGCEGIVAGHEDKINAIGGEDWEIWVDLNYLLGQEPSNYGAADHLLYAGENSA